MNISGATTSPGSANEARDPYLWSKPVVYAVLASPGPPYGDCACATCCAVRDIARNFERQLFEARLQSAAPVPPYFWLGRDAETE